MSQKLAVRLLTRNLRNRHKALALLRQARTCDPSALPAVLHELIHMSRHDSHWVLQGLEPHPSLSTILDAVDEYAATADRMLAEPPGSSQDLLFWETCYQGMLFVSCVQENITAWRGVTPAAADLLHRRALAAHASNTEAFRTRLKQAREGHPPPAAARRRAVTWQLERHTDLFGKYVRLIVARVAPGMLSVLPPPPRL